RQLGPAPCHVTMLLPLLFAVPMNTLFADTGVVMLIELNTMHMGWSQPAHATGPTVFALLTVRLHEKYSVPAVRFWSPDTGTASAILMRRCCATSAPSMLPSSELYAPMPPADWPCAQSMQFTSAGLMSTLKPSDVVRHVPGSRNSHHAGSVGCAV